MAAPGYLFSAHVIKDGYKVGCKVFEVKDSKTKPNKFTDLYLALIPNFSTKVLKFIINFIFY